MKQNDTNDTFLPLSHYKEGDTVILHRINGSGPFKKRLLEMGFIKGVAMKIVKYAPLRDPLELMVKGYYLSLRVNEAELVDVQKKEGING